MPSREFSHHHFALRQTDRFGTHNLIRALLFQQAVLMDPGGVCKCIGPDDRLVRLDRHARDLADEAARLRQLLRMNAGISVIHILANPQTHHDFLKRRVAGPLADPVDRAFDLPRPFQNRRKRVRYGQAEIIVAVDRDHGLAAVGDVHLIPSNTENFAIWLGAIKLFIDNENEPPFDNTVNSGEPLL